MIYDLFSSPMFPSPSYVNLNISKIQNSPNKFHENLTKKTLNHEEVV